MIYRIVGEDDLSDHAPPLVKKNASRHRTDILTGQGRLREPRKGARAPAIFAGCTPIHLAIGKKAFAGVPQVPRKTFWRLRESRKSHEKLFGVCGSPASVSENFLAFAGVPQVSRKKNGVCGNPANVSIRGKRSFPGRGVRLTPHRRPAGSSACPPVFKRHLNVISNVNQICPRWDRWEGGVCCCTPTAVRAND